LQVGYVNFTWKSGMKKYFYNFDRLQSFDETILEPPVVSVKTKGRVPKRPKSEHKARRHCSFSFRSLSASPDLAGIADDGIVCTHLLTTT
jgi:WIF domain